MPTTWKSRIAWGVSAALVVAGLVWFAWPQPVPVDLAIVTKGPMEVTVDDEGKTRVRHVYTVSAPTAGKVLRISHPHGKEGFSLHVGDRVTADETVVAIMQPTVPTFLDARSREELQAMLTAADAAIALAEAEVRRIEAALDFARSDQRRAQALSRTSSVPERTVEKAGLEVRTSEAALASAKAQLEVRRSERSTVAARLIDPATVSAGSVGSCCIQLRAPVTGVVLKIIQDSEATVASGTPLVEFGDPLDLEVIADLLSSDAVQIKAGASVRIDGWGGAPLQGRVTRVDPAGFLKVSALGIEEQRVRVTIDFTEPPEKWAGLGHDYRVIVHVTTWNAVEVLRVPVSALFRTGENWAVFKLSGGRAQVAVVDIAHRNNRIAEVLSGLSDGDRVILHPSDRVKEGVSVAERQTH